MSGAPVLLRSPHCGGSATVNAWVRESRSALVARSLVKDRRRVHPSMGDPHRTRAVLVAAGPMAGTIME